MRAAADDNELQESLLGDSQPSSTHVHPAQQQQLIHYQPFSVDSFIQWVVHSWLAFVSEYGPVCTRQGQATCSLPALLT